MTCWFWNIAAGESDTFWSELQEGWLRQGWGYDPGLDLRRLKKKRQQGEDLTKKEESAWDHCYEMLESVEPEDVVAVKNVPDGEHFTLVRVEGEYDFDLEGLDDFGHRLPVSIIQTFHKQSPVVPAPLTNALDRERYPVRRTRKHRDRVQTLATANHPNSIAGQPEAESEMLERWRGQLIPALRNQLKESLNARLAERLVLGMLQSDGLDVDYIAGPAEAGADVLSEVDIGYGLSSGLAVQVKMRWGTDNRTDGVEQLKQALEVHGADVGLLVTFADKLGPKLQEALEEAQKEYRIQAFWGEDLYRRLLETIFDPEFELPE